MANTDKLKDKVKQTGGELPTEILTKAVANTVDMIIKSIKVED